MILYIQSIDIYIISNDVYKNDVFLYDLTRTDDSIIIIESKSCMVIYNICVVYLLCMLVIKIMTNGQNCMVMVLMTHSEKWERVII